jgi:hypothetical protein
MCCFCVKSLSCTWALSAKESETKIRFLTVRETSLTLTEAASQKGIRRSAISVLPMALTTRLQALWLK